MNAYIYKSIFPLILAVAMSTPVFSATYTTYGLTANAAADRASFTAGLGGALALQQDFETYTPGTDLDGVEFLPGISATSNMDNVQAFSTSGTTVLFGFPRVALIDDYYDIGITAQYRAVGFDIIAYDPNTPGPGHLKVDFSDGDSTTIDVYPNNLTESDPLFFGVISDTPITNIRWTEGPELGGGNEETGLDNFIVSLLSIQVGIDIKPGSDPNSINSCSHGAVPVAILGSEDFDATNVDPATLIFAGAGTKVVGKTDKIMCSLEDANSDGYLDLVCHFVTMELTDVNPGDTSAEVTGNLYDGTPITGSDTINIVKDSCL